MEQKLNNRWIFGDLIGEGACGKVYEVFDSKQSTPFPIVAKVIPLPTLKGKKGKEQERICNTLNYENMLYTGLLLDFPFRPQLPDRFYGNDETAKVRYLVMEKLDMDLIAYCKLKGNSLKISDIGNIGTQILQGLQWLHRKCFLFVDVKPDNFMLKNDKVYFIDYGLVERWVSHDNAGAREQSNGGFAGTPAFCSLDVHNGSDCARKDDMEALAFVLLSLTSSGSLPWSVAKNDEECLEMKRSTDLALLCAQRNCLELGEIFKYCRGISYAEAPNYDTILTHLQSMQRRNDFVSQNSPTSSIKSVKKSTLKHAEVVEMTLEIGENSKTKRKATSKTAGSVVADVSSSFLPVVSAKEEVKENLQNYKHKKAVHEVIDVDADEVVRDKTTEGSGPFTSSMATRSKLVASKKNFNSPTYLKKVASRGDNSTSVPPLPYVDDTMPQRNKVVRKPNVKSK